MMYPASSKLHILRLNINRKTLTNIDKKAILLITKEKLYL